MSAIWIGIAVALFVAFVARNSSRSRGAPRGSSDSPMITDGGDDHDGNDADGGSDFADGGGGGGDGGGSSD